jgi:hypothetical protein
MFRGGAELLQRSLKALVPVVKSLVSAPSALWELDVDGYNEAGISSILDYARTLRSPLPGGQSDILVTKVMLGTFGCVPAFAGTSLEDSESRRSDASRCARSESSIGRIPRSLTGIAS